MSEKTFKIVDGDISDGYHTFNELYRHRILLFIYALAHGAFSDAYVVRDHFEGWDLIVARTAILHEQMSYHVPMEYRELYISLPRKTNEEHKWDGHTANHVLERLFHSIKGCNP